MGLTYNALQWGEGSSYPLLLSTVHMLNLKTTGGRGDVGTGIFARLSILVYGGFFYRLAQARHLQRECKTRSNRNSLHAPTCISQLSLTRTWRACLFEQNASWPMSFNYDDDFACCSYAYALPEKMDTESSVIRLCQRNRERKRDKCVKKPRIGKANHTECVSSLLKRNLRKSTELKQKEEKNKNTNLNYSNH